MAKYTCDDSLDSKEACAKAMKRCLDAQAASAAEGDDDDDEAFDFAKKKIEAAMKLFDAADGDGPDAKKRTLDDDEGGGDEGAEMSARGDSVELSAKSGASKDIWIQVAKPGKFQGHAAGAFEMNAKTFSEIIHNFSTQKNRAIPVDFEHASEQSPTHGTIPTYGAPAQGWITKLELRADGNLWGLVQWGELARAYIKKGQYKFLSPAIVFGSKDRVTGKSIGARLSSVALTNNPFLDGMQPIAAKRTEPSAEIDQDVVKTICSALQLPEGLSDARMACLTMSLVAGNESSAPSHGAALRKALNLPLTMSLTEVFATARTACGEVLLSNVSPPVSAVMNTQPPIPAQETLMGDQSNDKKELETQVSQLTLKLSAIESEKKQLLSDHESKIVTLTAENVEMRKQLDAFADREITGIVETAIQVWGEKRGLTAEMRPHLLRMAKNDREGFMALYPTVPANQRHLSSTIATGTHPVPGQAIGTGGGAEGGNVIRLREVISDADIPSVEKIADKLMLDAKALGVTMSREEAFSKAHGERTNLINTAARKRLAGNGS